MSYCRWSSDSYMCDLYCYEDVSGGFTTHVAGNRRSRRPETPDPMGDVGLALLKDKDHSAWEKLYDDFFAELDEIDLENLGLPYDGRSFNDDTLEEFLERVRLLARVGYNVPEYVEAIILEEIEEQNKN